MMKNIFLSATLFFAAAVHAAEISLQPINDTPLPTQNSGSTLNVLGNVVLAAAENKPADIKQIYIDERNFERLKVFVAGISDYERSFEHILDLLQTYRLTSEQLRVVGKLLLIEKMRAYNSLDSYLPTFVRVAEFAAGAATALCGAASTAFGFKLGVHMNSDKYKPLKILYPPKQVSAETNNTSNEGTDLSTSTDSVSSYDSRVPSGFDFPEGDETSIIEHQGVVLVGKGASLTTKINAFIKAKFPDDASWQSVLGLSSSAVCLAATGGAFATIQHFARKYARRRKTLYRVTQLMQCVEYMDSGSMPFTPEIQRAFQLV